VNKRVVWGFMMTIAKIVLISSQPVEVYLNQSFAYIYGSTISNQLSSNASGSSFGIHLPDKIEITSIFCLFSPSTHGIMTEIKSI